MTSIDMQTLRTRKWHLNITKHLMERHFAEPGGQLGTGGNSNTVGPLGIPCQRDLKNRSMATCDTFLWSPLLKGTICPDFFPATWPKKSWLLKKSFAADFFWSEFRKKNVIKKVETDIRWDIFLIIYAFPLQKQQGSRVTAFFCKPFEIPGAEWNHLGLGLCQNRCDANRWKPWWCSLRAVSKAAPAFAKAGSTAQLTVVAGNSLGVFMVFMVWNFHTWNHQVIPAPHGPLGGGLLFPHEVIA